MNVSLLFFKSFAVVVFFLFLFQASYAQETKSSYVGVLLAGELQYRKVQPNLGLFYERKFTPKSGIELGVFYRTDRNRFFISIDQSSINIAETITIRENYLNFQILYRYSTRFAAFSFGPTVDVFSGWNQIDENLIKVSDYTRNPRVEIGALLKVGKEIPLKGRLRLEPELRMGFRSFGFPEGYIGLGVKLKEMLSSRE
jgi:hypothetical protein